MFDEVIKKHMAMNSMSNQLVFLASSLSLLRRTALHSWAVSHPGGAAVTSSSGSVSLIFEIKRAFQIIFRRTFDIYFNVLAADKKLKCVDLTLRFCSQPPCSVCHPFLSPPRGPDAWARPQQGQEGKQRARKRAAGRDFRTFHHLAWKAPRRWGVGVQIGGGWDVESGSGLQFPL